MEFKTEKVERYGIEVWQHTEMDELRLTQCLCTNCNNIGTCNIVLQGLRFCVDYSIAFAVTRCPNFWKKNTN